MVHSIMACHRFGVIGFGKFKLEMPVGLRLLGLRVYGRVVLLVGYQKESQCRSEAFDVCWVLLMLAVFWQSVINLSFCCASYTIRYNVR